MKKKEKEGRRRKKMEKIFSILTILYELDFANILNSPHRAQSKGAEAQMR